VGVKPERSHWPSGSENRLFVEDHFSCWRTVPKLGTAMGSLIFRDVELHIYISNWLVRPGAFFRACRSAATAFVGQQQSSVFRV
jgi:hypothetical protein